MSAEAIDFGGDGDAIELTLTEARNRLPELADTVIRDGGIVYLTRYGRRVAALVPTDVAEDHERIEDAYLSALADDARADSDPPLSTPQLIRELGL